MEITLKVGREETDKAKLEINYIRLQHLINYFIVKGYNRNGIISIFKDKRYKYINPGMQILVESCEYTVDNETRCCVTIYKNMYPLGIVICKGQLLDYLWGKL